MNHLSRSVLIGTLVLAAVVAFSPVVGNAAASPASVCLETQSNCQRGCLVGVTAEGRHGCVPDPCYTTQCF